MNNNDYDENNIMFRYTGYSTVTLTNELINEFVQRRHNYKQIDFFC